jgi:hypothetical protein
MALLCVPSYRLGEDEPPSNITHPRSMQSLRTHSSATCPGFACIHKCAPGLSPGPCGTTHHTDFIAIHPGFIAIHCLCLKGFFSGGGEGRYIYPWWNVERTNFGADMFRTKACVFVSHPCSFYPRLSFSLKFIISSHTLFFEIVPT